MKTANIAWVAAIVVVLIGGLWYFMPGTNNVDTEGQSAAVGTQDSTGQNTVPVLAVAKDETLGDFLVASNGMTLYLYTKDTSGVTNCYDMCAVNWPPYMHAASEPLVAGAGITGAITTITRTDGGQQVAYNGIPLYFWIKDTKVGDTTGQNVGGVWFVVKP